MGGEKDGGGGGRWGRCLLWLSADRSWEKLHFIAALRRRLKSFVGADWPRFVAIYVARLALLLPARCNVATRFLYYPINPCNIARIRRIFLPFFDVNFRLVLVRVAALLTANWWLSNHWNDWHIPPTLAFSEIYFFTTLNQLKFSHLIQSAFTLDIPNEILISCRKVSENE